MKYIVEYGSNQQDTNRIESNSRDARKHGRELLGTDGGGYVYVGLKSGKVVSHARYNPNMGGSWDNVCFDPNTIIGEPYYIHFGTGAGDFQIITPDIKYAKKAADEATSYTQCDVVICDEDDNEITRRTWVGVRTDFEDQEHPIDFGDYGYYTDWS